MRCLSEVKSCRLFDLAYAHNFSCLVGLLHRTVSVLPQCERDYALQSAGTSVVPLPGVLRPEREILRAPEAPACQRNGTFIIITGHRQAARGGSRVGDRADSRSLRCEHGFGSATTNVQSREGSEFLNSPPPSAN
jgi:hypothetical protein